MVRFEVLGERQPAGAAGQHWEEAWNAGAQAGRQDAAVRRVPRSAPHQRRARDGQSQRAGDGQLDDGRMVNTADGMAPAIEGGMGKQGDEQPDDRGSRYLAKGHAAQFAEPNRNHLPIERMFVKGFRVNRESNPLALRFLGGIDVWEELGPVMSPRTLVENADTVSLICALLVRFPELASIRSMPADRTVRLTFAVRQKLDRAAQSAVVEAIRDHVESFLVLAKDEAETLRIECESDRAMTFVHVTRDLESFTKDELELQAMYFTQRFGDALVRNPPPDDHFEADPAAQDEAALYAIEALRDPAQSKSLVGFREEKRVLVYFLKSKKAKASARR